MAGKHSTWQVVLVMHRLLLVTVVVFGVVFGVACDRGAATGTAGSTDGAQLYQAMCASCHGPEGKPTASLVAQLGVRDLTSAELRARITPELVEKQIRTGSPNKLMPSFVGAITDEQIKAIAAYVSSAEFLAH